MNVCTICGADGVLLTTGHWYCVNHIDQAFIATAMFVAQTLGKDDQEAKAKAEDWLREL
jgi:hypothetical protein